MALSLARQFIENHLQTYQEGGYEFTEFRSGSQHDPDEMDNIEAGFVKFSQSDGDQVILAFRDGSVVLYDENGEALNYHTKSMAASAISLVVESELSLQAEARAENEAIERNLRAIR